MTDQTIPADEVRKIIAFYRDGASDRGGMILDALHALLPAPPRPTLADMTLDEQDECAGMQADLAQGDRVVILDGTPDAAGLVQVLEKSLDVYRAYPAEVTPRPDLPRMEWPGDEKPVPAPALPDGWRLADHEDHGRVIVTNPTPDRNGRVHFVIPSVGLLGFDWLFCDPDELTYIDTEQESPAPAPVPPNTLDVGSVWRDSGALAEACEESGRDQIVVTDKDGDVSVWGQNAGWWEGSTPTVGYEPFTILHAGKKADQ